jgi:hypothetical protein
MLPIWPNTDRIPVWFWLLLVAAFIGVGFAVSDPDFDHDAAFFHMLQVIAGTVLAVGVLWAWRGGLVLLRIRALRHRAAEGDAVVTDLWSSSQRVKRTGPLEVGHSTLTHYFLAYRFGHPGGEAECKRIRIDKKLAATLRKGATFRVYYLPDRPQVSAPVGIAIREVEVHRWIQLVAGVVLIIWSVGWLAPGVLWGIE